jgi:hypothetical protein
MSLHYRDRSRPSGLLAVVLVLAALALAVTAAVASAARAGGGSTSAGQSAQPAAPLISLGQVSLVDGVATVHGSVTTDAHAGASANGQVDVAVNNRPVGIAADGHFTASLNVGGQAAVVVKASSPAVGETYTISVPTSAIPAGGTPTDALATLDAAGVEVMLPADGFTSVDGTDVQVGLHVLGTSGLARLQINGQDVLAQLQAGTSSSQGGAGSTSTSAPKPGGGSVSDGGKSAGQQTAVRTVSGSSKNVTVTVTDTGGVSQTSTFRLRRVRSVIRVGRAMSVSAFGAQGLRIASIRFDTHAAASKHRVGVTVRVRDRRRYLVRDAVVVLRPLGRAETAGASVLMTDVYGKARFSLPLGRTSLGKRLHVAVTARTPRASAHRTASVLVPAGCGC